MLSKEALNLLLGIGVLSLLKKYLSLHLLGYSICESIPDMPWVSFFKKKAISFLFFEFPFIFSYIYFSHRTQNLDSCTPKIGVHL